MENHDQRRRQGSDDQSRRYPHNDERGRDRQSWRPDDEHTRRRATNEETGWLDYDRDPSRSDESQRDRGDRQDYRYGQGGSERTSFSPDWSREGAQARYSDDPYYSRNRDRDFGDYSRSGEGRYMQRASHDEQGTHYRGYYSRSAEPFQYAGGQGYLYSESITLHGPYSGRGPKGYKRSDQQIVEEASQRLERDGNVDASDIEVTAEDGIITLRGTVPDRSTKRRAEECVESVYGARDVMNELKCSGGQQAHESQSSQRSQSARGTTTRGAAGGGSEQPTEDKKPKH